MAESENPPVLVAPETENAVECQAPGCKNWFVKRSGRHIYCKAENCTYKRGTPVEQELTEPVGTTLELLRRLQDPEGGGEVGPEVVGPRLRAVTEAQRANDEAALYGALLDAAVALVSWADRVKAKTMPKRPARPVTAAPPNARQMPPQGLVTAVILSHRRTLSLGDARVDALWRLMAAKQAADEAEAGARQTIGSEASGAAQENAIKLRRDAAQAEAAFQSVESAWQERRHMAKELEAAGTPAGGANGRQRAAAA